MSGTCRICLFADDITIWTTRNSYEECQTKKLHAISVIEDYCAGNWIVINPRKTAPLPCGNKPWTASDLQVEVADRVDHPSTEVRLLDATIDSKLKFRKHGEATRVRLLKRCQVMASFAGRSWRTDERTLQITRKAIVEPIAS